MMWYDKRAIRFFLLVAIYLLGALGAAVLGIRQGSLVVPMRERILDVLSSWPLMAIGLPLGTLYYLEGWGGLILGGLALVGLIFLARRIVRAHSRGALIVGYIAFIVLVAVLARGCAYNDLALP